MLRRAFTPLLVLLLGVLTLLAGGVPAQAAPVTVINGTQFTDTAGAVVHAHGGGVIKVGSSYYWFGENRNADNTFRVDIDTVTGILQRGCALPRARAWWTGSRTQ